MNSFSVVSSNTSTVPCAGATINPLPEGTFASGSRKKLKKSHQQQQQDRGERQENDFKTGLPGFARVFHAFKLKSPRTASKIKKCGTDATRIWLAENIERDTMVCARIAGATISLNGYENEGTASLGVGCGCGFGSGLLGWLARRARVLGGASFGKLI
jgi:hypothetical protein